MTEQSTAIAKADDRVGLDLPAQKVLTVASVGDVERIEQSVVIPAIYQYSLARYGQQPKVMLTSDAYDYLNRAMGVQIHQPLWVHDETGKKVRNPIHRPDYLYIRAYAIYYNDIGQLMSYREDVEVDYKLVWMDARINSKSARVEVDDEGQPKFAKNGSPIIRLDPDDEKRALKALSQLRTFGLRYAQTVVKTRLLKVVTGIRTLPLTQPQPFAVRVVGFKDNLTPDQRIKKAESDVAAMFGTEAAEPTGLSPEEMEMLNQIEGMDSTDDLDQELVNAALQDDSGEPDERAPEPRRVGPKDADDEPSLGFDGTKPKGR